MNLATFLDCFKQSTRSGPDQDPEQSLRLATAGVLLEVAYADDDFSPAEEKSLLEYLQKTFAMTKDVARALLERANELRKKTIDHWTFTSFVKNNAPLPFRMEIVKTMWRMVYADGILHQNEEYLVRKLAELLGIEHHLMIEAKLQVKSEVGGGKA
ncbi:MAG TPA: TerB family tellurite resistance protein [Thermoanaerobaculia bacterium]|nr:TerB family tellurite resistance protein [Thermoanaerobaculia bacterium]